MSDRPARLGRRVGAYLLGALPAEERAGFEAHLDGCAACRGDVASCRSPPTRCPSPCRRSRRRRRSRGASWRSSSPRRSCWRRRRAAPTPGPAPAPAPRARAAAGWLAAAPGARAARAACCCSPAARRRRAARRRATRRGRSSRRRPRRGARGRRSRSRRRAGDARRPRPAAAARGRVYQVWLQRAGRATRAEPALSCARDGVGRGRGARLARRRRAGARHPGAAGGSTAPTQAADHHAPSPA